MLTVLSLCSEFATRFDDDLPMTQSMINVVYPQFFNAKLASGHLKRCILLANPRMILLAYLRIVIRKEEHTLGVLGLQPRMVAQSMFSDELATKGGASMQEFLDTCRIFSFELVVSGDIDVEDRDEGILEQVADVLALLADLDENVFVQHGIGCVIQGLGISFHGHRIILGLWLHDERISEKSWEVLKVRLI